MTKKLSHIDQSGNPAMVNVGEKAVTKRLAKARSIVWCPDIIMQALEEDEWKTKKGPVFQTAILAGVMGVKKTSDIIPLCHPLPISGCKIKILPHLPNEIWVECEVEVEAKTGVEMEALTGASVAALTIYDMCKALSHEMVIKETRLLQKSGGRRHVGSPE
jgi:cyclic pyranopterin phosphate synthase